MNFNKTWLKIILITLLVFSTVTIFGYGIVYWHTASFTKTITVSSTFDAKANWCWIDYAYAGTKPYDSMIVYDGFIDRGTQFTSDTIGVIANSESNVGECYTRVVVSGEFIQLGGSVDVSIYCVELCESPSWSVPNRVHLSTIHDIQGGMDAVKVSDLFGGTGDTWLIESDWVTELHYLEYVFTYDAGLLPAGDYDLSIEIELGDSTL